MNNLIKLAPKKIVATTGDLVNTPSVELIEYKHLKRSINVQTEYDEIEDTKQNNSIKGKSASDKPTKTKTVANKVTKTKLVESKGIEEKTLAKRAVKAKSTTKKVAKKTNVKQIKAAKKTTSKNVEESIKDDFPPMKIVEVFEKETPPEVHIIEEGVKVRKTKKHIAEIKDLRLGFTSKTSKQYKEIIRGVDLKIYPGEVLGILGESGSGKTVITSSMLGILGENAKITEGQVLLQGVDVAHWDQKQWDKSGFRGPVITSVFQNPMKTLNPVRKIADQFIETLVINDRVDSKKEAVELAKEYLRITQIKNIDQVMNSYAHELSGGMIQRVVIAMALSTEAQIIVMDEPTTALDPVVQAEIINLIIDIKEKYNTAFIFISHDIGVIGTVADKIAVMYAGRIAEYGSTKEIIWNPKHPYTWNLLMAMPDLNQGKELFTIPGSVPADSTGDEYEVFAPRNDYALGIDFKEESPKVVISPTHYVYSNLYVKEAPEFEPPKLIATRWTKYKKKGGK